MLSETNLFLISFYSSSPMAVMDLNIYILIITVTTNWNTFCRYMKSVSSPLFPSGLPKRWRHGHPFGQCLGLPRCCHFTTLWLLAGKSHRQREGPADSIFKDEQSPGWVPSARGQGRTILCLMALVRCVALFPFGWNWRHLELIEMSGDNVMSALLSSLKVGNWHF